MPKRENRSRRSAPKRRPARKSVEEYLAHVPQNARPILNELRTVIRSSVPADAVEVISYGIPAFRQKRILVWYAAFAKHCSLFPTNLVIEAFKNELKGFTTSKGTVQFPLNKPLPVALIEKMVKARVAASKSPQ